jgi:hypothetical protein
MVKRCGRIWLPRLNLPMSIRVLRGGVRMCYDLAGL